MKDIYIVDDFFPKEVLEYIENDKIDYEEVVTPGKSFWVKKPKALIARWISGKIEKIEGNKIYPILSFFRQAKEGQDNDWRIHNDSIIDNQQPDRAIVIYISDNNATELNGTAFWSHKLYGDRFISNKKTVDPEEFNRLLQEDSNNLDMWELNSVVGHKKNRLLSYPCNYFHSKYPNEFIESREVFVMFYKVDK
jgi:hypothetical protein